MTVLNARVKEAQRDGLKVSQGDRIELVSAETFNGGVIVRYIRHLPAPPAGAGKRWTNRTHEFRAAFFDGDSDLPSWAMLCGAPGFAK